MIRYEITNQIYHFVEKLSRFSRRSPKRGLYKSYNDNKHQYIGCVLSRCYFFFHRHIQEDDLRSSHIISIYDQTKESWLKYTMFVPSTSIRWENFKLCDFENWRKARRWPRWEHLILVLHSQVTTTGSERPI